MKSETTLLCLQDFVVFLFVLSLFFLQKPKLVVLFRSLCAKFAVKLCRKFVKFVVTEIENAADLVKNDRLSEVDYDVPVPSVEAKEVQEIASTNIESTKVLNESSPVLLTQAGEQSISNQSDIKIGHSISQDVQVDLVYDGCTLQAAKLCQIETLQKTGVDSQAQTDFHCCLQNQADQIIESFETKQTQELVSLITLPPQNQVKSTSPASIEQESSDWQLLLQEFPLDKNVWEDKLQEQEYSKYEDLPPLHKISEGIFRAVFNKISPEEHCLMSFLTAEEEWEYLDFCEAPFEWTPTSGIEEELHKLAHEFFDFLTEEEEEMIHSHKLVSKRSHCVRFKYVSTLPTIFEEKLWDG